MNDVIIFKSNADIADELIKMLKSDLMNEYNHMHFYMCAGVLVQGLHREELGEYFLEEAASEQKHCEEFSRKIIGLGGYLLPFTVESNIPHATDAKELLTQALQMESEVVATFHERLKKCTEFDSPQATVIGLFYEDQIMDSYKSVEHIKEMLK